MLLTLWIGATAFFIGASPLSEAETSTGNATDALQSEPIDLPAVPAGPTPAQSRPPDLPECDEDSCLQPVTRAELAVALSRALWLPVTTIDFFRDDDQRPEQAAINRVAAAGITGGCDEERFCPDGEITRAQLASFLARALDLPDPDSDAFTDDAGLAHEDAINRVAAAGITAGCGDGRFCPDAGVTKGQLIEFLRRAVDLAAPDA